MHSTLEFLIVAAIVGGAALYALWRFVPGLKQHLAGPLARTLARCGLISDARAATLATSLGKNSGCGSCDSCGACAPKESRTRH
jgi:hypothetical protein